MSNKGNYGYFGTGSSGYAHYMQSFNETTNSTNYSKSHSTPKESRDDDTIWLIIGIIFFLALRPISIPVLLIKIGLE